MEKTVRKPKHAVWLAVIAVLLALAMAADVVCSVYWDVLGAAFTDVESVTDENLMDKAVAESRAINQEIVEEGAVLLKNDGVLPLASEIKTINVYGIISGNIYMNTSGSGSVNNPDSVSLKTALENEGFAVNEALWKLIAAQKVEGSSAAINEGAVKSELVSEISLSQYESAAPWQSAKDFSKIALVTFGRGGAEGSDLARATDTTYGYLELSASEIALLEKLKTEGFTVVTLINSSHVMELGPVIENSDAILWIGGPGLTGLNGVARILSGAVSPSGRLVDTWMYEQETSSTYYTAQQYSYYNGNTVVGGYTNFNEGIYVGYRWYETADAEGYWADYDSVVAYPFGFGLSYGDLSERIVSVDDTGDALVFTVEAENTNATPSKNVWELYVEKPYTNGGVEMAKVELAGFAKSGLLANSSEQTTITVLKEDLASYDTSANGGSGAYVLAGGDYRFYLATGETGAHIWKTADEAHQFTITLPEKVYAGADKRGSDGVAAQNQLANVLPIDANAGFTLLSRANRFANAEAAIGPQAAYTAVTDGDIIAKQLKDSSAYGTYCGETWDSATEAKNRLTLADLYTTDAEGNPLYEIDEETSTKRVVGEVDYDDPRWEALIAEMSVDEMQQLIGRAGWQTAAVASIKKEKGSDYDGPSGLSNLMQNTLGIQTKCTSFMSEPVSASTWNLDLIERLGKAVGQEANASSQLGWYAPGVNLHRTPFGGRNAEYFSEDALLSGKMAAAESRGAMSVGLYCMAKHFAFNDIEANRTSGENCWMTEQTARELYLKAFEIGIKGGDIPGLMTSYMWIGGDWCGANHGLLTDIVRNEWGFNGVITTDNASAGGGTVIGMGSAKLIYAGGDMVLTSSLIKLPEKVKTSNEGISAMKSASKHILYTVAKAQLNRLEAIKKGDNRFIPLFITANAVLYGAALIVAVLYVIKLLSYKKRKTAVK